MVSFPVGLGVGKTLRIGKLPVQFWVEADYYGVRPAMRRGRAAPAGLTLDARNRGALHRETLPNSAT
jgi:hypothetical protein